MKEYQQFQKGNDSYEPDLLFGIGRCLKGLGDYLRALEYIERASQGKKDDPVIYAELADCYAFINEVRTAKAFFREAFFIDPQRVELTMLESLLIRNLIKELKAQGLSGENLKEWLPVYGVLYGVLNVRRELRPLEYGKLRQSMYSLEGKLQSEGYESPVIPRLLNRYFWLIDHYICTKEGRDKIDEILEKMKSLNKDIYALYVN